jgi:hypothetical protein
MMAFWRNGSAVVAVLYRRNLKLKADQQSTL